MGQNFLSCDREQVMLLPASVAEWLPEGHLARFVIEVVERLDLAAFYAVYRADGSGRRAHDPAMMVALVLYNYAVGVRSSRAIERRCVEDVACRFVAANRAPDHVTINRFRGRHQESLSALFGEVLVLCARAGMVRVGMVAVDSTKLAADASLGANRTYEGLRAEAERIVEEAKERGIKMRVEAEDYIDQKLAAFEILLNKTLGTVAKGREQLRGDKPKVEVGLPPEGDAVTTSGPFDAAELRQPAS